MSRVCEICGKEPMSGNNVSHSKRHTKRTWKPNIVKVRIADGHKLSVCTRCRKSLVNSSKKTS